MILIKFYLFIYLFIFFFFGIVQLNGCNKGQCLRNNLSPLIVVTMTPSYYLSYNVTLFQIQDIIKKSYFDDNKASTLIPLLSYFPYVFILWLKLKMWHKLSYACLIIKKFSEDRDVGIIYLSTMFQLNGDTGSIIGQESLETHTHTHTHRQTETDTLPIHHIGLRRKYDCHHSRMINLVERCESRIKNHYDEDGWS